MMGCESPKFTMHFSVSHLLCCFADGADKGIIPLTCSELFVRTQSKEEADPNLKFTVEVSYIEVSKNDFA